MSHASTDELQRLISDRLRQGPVGASLRQVLVTSPDDSNDDVVVRIMIIVADADGIDRAAADDAVRSVREIVAQADDRVPSIRFSEAA